jgi:uncharacterized heparinase superfamily protein
VDRRPDRWRIYRLALSEAGRAVRGNASRGLASLRLGTPRPTRLVLAPQDLRTADPTVAGDVYAGFFVFSGRALSTGGRSPFDFAPPSRAWGEALYGFGWLRHLRAAGTALAQANARSLVDEFITTANGDRDLAGEPQVAARRLISFLSQSPLLLEGADHAFYHRFLRAIGRLARDLERDAKTDNSPQRRLIAAIGLCYGGLCCAGLSGSLKQATRLLSRELDAQILPDGGHASRNPHILIDLLFDLLPLRHMFASRETDVPDSLLRAIDRMLPMVRLFRHGDGTLSHFNGMGLSAADHLATLLTYDDMRSQPIHHAPYSGYERLEAGRSLVVADVGACPPAAFAAEAAASCLSFEFSSGRSRIIVNCGLPRAANRAVIEAARSTPAHSTATLGTASSNLFLAPEGGAVTRFLAGWLEKRLGPVALAGVREVSVERSERDHVQGLDASHDGYRARYGITHQRRLRLSADGQWLEGEDSFSADHDTAAEEAVIRFHLAPGVKPSRSHGGAVMLLLPNREAWHFEASPADAWLEDSIFFSAPDGARRTEQIVLRLRLNETRTARWRFERLQQSAPASASQRRSEPSPELL